MQTRYFTSAFVRKGDSIVMVKHQGASDPEPFWSLPGGRVEVGETPEETIIREVREETGLTVHTVGTLAYIVEIHRNEENELGFAYVYEITEWSGEFSINDPDNKVLEVALIPQAQAIDALAKISYVPMCATCCLSERGSGCGYNLPLSSYSQSSGAVDRIENRANNQLPTTCNFVIMKA
jgi:ADP-ribose pyrophosphatase YjhB (NUDIX family)